MPKPLPMRHQMYRLMERRQAQVGQTMEYAQVTGRKPIDGNGAATYSMNFRGGSAGSITTMAGDYEPGQTVVVARHGANGANTHQIIGGAPANRRATQAGQSVDIDVTDQVLL